jgi:hypothetical protein
MPGYIKAAFHRYQHPTPIRAEHEPHKWNPPIYGANTQYAVYYEDSPFLAPKYANCLQQLGGTLLYHA